jgi:flagellar assembly protein FliH
MARIVRAHRSPATAPSSEVQSAQLQADAIIASARSQADQLLQQAAAEGREQGRAELAAQLIDIAEKSSKARGELERAALQAALQVAEHIVGRALELEPSRIADITAPLLAKVRRAAWLRVHVHPADEAALHLAVPELCARLQLTHALHIVADSAMARGGCVIESSIGELDARIETRIEAFARALGVTPK